MPTEQDLIEAVRLVEQHGSIRAAAKASGIGREALRSRHAKALALGIVSPKDHGLDADQLLNIAATAEDHEAVLAARKGHAPASGMTLPAPAGFMVPYVTVEKAHKDSEGNSIRTWTRFKADAEAQHKALLAFAEGLASKLPKAEPVLAPVNELRDDLLNLYPISDFHLGMLSWKPETGDDWDTDIAENFLVQWFAQAIKCSPDTKEGLLVLLGDFMHFCGMDAVTPEHGNILDADTRLFRLVDVAGRVIRRVIRMLLTKHEKVTVIVAEGNHDRDATPWLQTMLAAVFEEEPRVVIMRRPDPYYCYVFGDVSLFFHHGHKRKFAELETVFIAKFREQFGNTKYSFAHTGHLHHDRVEEKHTMVLEQHRTLAAPDAYASRGGYISGRDAKVITYSKQYGAVSRQIISAEMVKHIGSA